MKILDNKEMVYKDKPIMTGDGEVFNTFSLLKTILESSAYQNSSELIKASVILGKLKVEEVKLNIEDVDYEFIKRFAQVYQPLVSKGLLFSEFYQQLE